MEGRVEQEQEALREVMRLGKKEISRNIPSRRASHPARLHSWWATMRNWPYTFCMGPFRPLSRWPRTRREPVSSSDLASK